MNRSTKRFIFYIIYFALTLRRQQEIRNTCESKKKKKKKKEKRKKNRVYLNVILYKNVV